MTSASTIVVCPGQGSQRPGMLAPWSDALARSHPDFLPRLSEACGLDMDALGRDADAQTLQTTDIAQPLTLVTSLASALVSGLADYQDDYLTLLCPRDSRAPELSGASPASAHASGPYVAGHSLGYLTALTLAGALTTSEAVRLAAIRGQAMSQCCQSEDGAMSALIGGDRADVLAAIARAGAHVANINGAAQVVAAGSRQALARLCLPSGCRALPLAVAGAFHSPAMAPACTVVATAVKDIPPRPLRCTLIDDADGAVHSAGTSSCTLLARLAPKICQPVRWDTVHAAFVEHGVTTLIELAPAGTLGRLARREAPPLDVTMLRTP